MVITPKHQKQENSQIMKKILTSFYLVITTAALLAQDTKNHAVEDMELIEVVLPSPGSTLITGMSYDFKIKVKNAGGEFPCACFDFTLVVGNDTVEGSILTISFFSPGDTVAITTPNQLTISPGNNGNAIAYLTGINDVNQNNDTLHLSYNIGSTGISDVESGLPEMDIYLNPNTGKLIFKMVNNEYPPDQLMLYDITGSVVRKYGSGIIKNTTSYMDISDLPAGIYVAVVNSGGNIYSKKLAIY